VLQVAGCPAAAAVAGAAGCKPPEGQQQLLAVAQQGEDSHDVEAESGGLHYTPPVADKLALVAYCASELLLAAAHETMLLFPVQQDHAAAPAAAARGEGTFSLLPWLMLLGRCFLIWAQQLQQMGPGQLSPAAGAAAPSAA
jgi:hypothetical protein